MRLFLTGLGLVTPLAIGADATWARLVRGERGIRPVELFSTEGYRARLGGEVVGLSASPPTEAAWSRTAQMAYVAAREAIESAGLDVKAARVGLVVSGTTGGMFENEEMLASLSADSADPAAAPRRSQSDLAGLASHPLWATTDRLNEALGPFVRVRMISSACSGGANALIVAASWLLSGEVDAVVAGGTDGLCRLTFTGFHALGALDPEPCRPFDARRRGLNLGEGAGFLVVSRADRMPRNKTPLAELAGWSLAAEAHHITNPEQSGTTAARVMSNALARAGLSASQVDYVNAHGTGTPLNDPMEATAIVHALGQENASRVPVSSSKAQIGHTLAAAGAIEAGITALVIAKQTIVPTAGLAEIDPACARLSHVLGEGRSARVRMAITNAFGFGGMDSALVLTEPELGPEHAPTRRAVVVTAAATLTPAGLLGTRDSASVLDSRIASTPSELPPLDPLLDLDRARRLDRPSRLGAIVVGRALADAGADAQKRSEPIGVILGSNFGGIDASAAFMHRVFSKGPRLASPAEFPNLVPSSPVGHVSIYLGLRGPVFAAAELETCGECATMQAAELVASGEADAIAAGYMEETHAVVERTMNALFARADAVASPAEGGGAVVLEAEDVVRARGGAPVARLALCTSWHRSGDDTLPELPAPRDPRAALVVLSPESAGLEALVARTAWGKAPRARTGGSGGTTGAIAIAGVVGRMARGEVRDALILGLARGRGYAVVLVSP
ncbi:MAG: beta-ketoacyl synthase N-terminal-like domain-containing protein [Polyangiaceae bacterium]